MKAIFSIILCICILKANSQNKRVIECLFLKSSFNLNEIKSNFNLKSDDTLILIDKQNKLQGLCSGFNWGTNIVRLENDSLVRYKLSTMDPYFVYKNRCEVFILDNYVKKDKRYYIDILQPCSSQLTKSVIRRKKGHAKLMTVTKYVL
jgi:hypothetical protein